MEYTPIGAVTAVPNPAAGRAAAYGLEPVLIDGNDPNIVYASARHYIDRARAGGGPALIEAVTYRHGGHSRGDQEKYRPGGQLKHWLARDPIPAYRRGFSHAALPHTTGLRIDSAPRRSRGRRANRPGRTGAGPGHALTDVWSDGGRHGGTDISRRGGGCDRAGDGS